MNPMDIHISFTLPLASLAEATNTSPEWLIEHQADLSDYIRGYWVYEDDIDHDNLGMLTQAVEDVKNGVQLFKTDLCESGIMVSVPPTQTQTDTMDLRTFFMPKTKTKTETKTELPAEWKAWVDGLPEEGRKIVLNEIQARLTELTKPKTETDEAYLDEAYRQGFKDAKEESDLLGGWKFEPTLSDIANHRPTMSKEVDEEMLYRHPTEAELDQVIWAGELFRFPIAYTWDGIEYTTYQAAKGAKTWTLGEFLERAQFIYSRVKGRDLKAMGDHVFFEGFIGDTFHCGS
jgi:hypothetical protein